MTDLTNTYKVVGPVDVLDHKPGSEFEHTFTPEDEAALIRGGRIEIVPRPYRVIGTSRVFETDPGGTFEAGLQIEQESALFFGGHIERVTAKSTKNKEA